MKTSLDRTEPSRQMFVGNVNGVTVVCVLRDWRSFLSERNGSLSAQLRLDDKPMKKGEKNYTTRSRNDDCGEP
jgi:hypothetical protein